MAKGVKEMLARAREIRPPERDPPRVRRWLRLGDERRPEEGQGRG